MADDFPKLFNQETLTDYRSEEVRQKIKNGELHAIVGMDTTIAQDVFRFASKIPKNLFWALYDPKGVDVNDLGMLAEKGARGLTDPLLTLIQHTAFGNNRLRTVGINTLRELDLQPEAYIEPFLQKTDKIVQRFISPYVVTEVGGTAKAGIMGYAAESAQKIADLSLFIKEKGLNGDNKNNVDSAYKEILSSLESAQQNSRKEIELVSSEIVKLLKEIDDTEVPLKKEKKELANGKTVITESISKSFKTQRLNTLREHALRIKKCASEIDIEISTSRAHLIKLLDSHQLPSDEFADKLSRIGKSLDNKITSNRLLSEQLSDLTYVRQTRMMPHRKNGKLIKIKEAQVEHLRKLMLGVKIRFTPDAPRTLSIVEPKTEDHNAENFYIKTIEYSKEAYDKDGNYRDIGARGKMYGTELADYIAGLYGLSREEDAIEALQYLGFQTGPKSEIMFPTDMKDLIREKLINMYMDRLDHLENDQEYANLDKKQRAAKYIDRDKHISAFLQRAEEIRTDKAHSPEIYGQRDVRKKYVLALKRYIYARMYAPNGTFVATPYHDDYIQQPIAKQRGRLIAYLTGGTLVPIEDTGRTARASSILETKVGLGIKRRWFTWEPKAEDDKTKGLRSWYKRAPAPVKMLSRGAQLAGIPVALAVATGGLSLPAMAAYPIFAAGAVGGLNYSLKTLKGAWSFNVVNKPIKFALKWSAITAVGVGATGALAVFSPLAAAGLVASIGAMNYKKIKAISNRLQGKKAELIGEHKTFKDFRIEEDLPFDSVKIDEINQDDAPIPQISIKTKEIIDELKQERSTEETADAKNDFNATNAMADALAANTAVQQEILKEQKRANDLKERELEMANGPSNDQS